MRSLIRSSVSYLSSKRGARTLYPLFTGGCSCIAAAFVPAFFLPPTPTRSFSFSVFITSSSFEYLHHSPLNGLHCSEQHNTITTRELYKARRTQIIHHVFEECFGYSHHSLRSNSGTTPYQFTRIVSFALWLANHGGITPLRRLPRLFSKSRFVVSLSALVLQ